MTYRNTYTIETLTCSDCAMHIVENIEKLNYVNEVHINYDNKTIAIAGSKVLTEEQVKEVIAYILADNHCHEHNYLRLHNIITEEFSFEDIDCPNCASKVERELNKDKNIIDAQVNFINKKIIIKHLNNVEIYDVVSKIVRKIEHHAKINKDNTHEYECHNQCDGHGHHHGNDIEQCGCHHHHGEENTSDWPKKVRLILAIVGVVIFLTMTILSLAFDELESVCRIGFIIAYLLVGYDIIYQSFRRIIHGDVFNENLLMVIASVGALIINESIEAIMVMLLYRIGEYYQEKATEKSKNSIKSLMELKSNTVTLSNGEVKNIKEVEIGEVISIKVGEKIPLDGIIKNGATDVDMKALTGESQPVYISAGEEILSGAVNLTKVIEIEVTKKDYESTISKVLKLVQEASNQKSKTEQFITKFARYYTPIVLLLALIVGLVQYFVFHTVYNEVLNNVFSILVISCPCALVISVPLGYFAGIGRSSAAGILIKGGSYLEALSSIESFVFDKTGTITKGNFQVMEVNPVRGVTKEEVIEIIARAEQFSAHPIAQAIKSSYGNSLKSDERFDIEEISGLGLKVTSDKLVLVGNKTLMENNNIKYVPSESVGTILYLSVDGKFYGSICIRDEIKENSKDVIEVLNKKYQTIVLTGDTEDVANLVCKEVGIKEVKAQLLPKQKYDYLKEIIKNSKKNVVYVGDGINDTPALKISDIGIAMGGVGSDSAKECADIVIMNDDLSKIADAIVIAKHTKRTIIQNICFALGIKFVALITGIFGLFGSFTMIVAVLADVGVCLLAILNTMRILRLKI